MEYLKLGLTFFTPYVVYEVDCNLVGSEISASLSQLGGFFFFFFLVGGFLFEGVGDSVSIFRSIWEEATGFRIIAK